MKMRTSKPAKGNKYYTLTSSGGYSKCVKGKPTDSCNALANCVGYANGRFAEIQGENKIKYQFICNAENFIEKAKAYGLKVSKTPTLGGIMVWQKGKTLKGKDGAGHVAIVERIDNSNQIYTSESSYGGKAFFNATRKNTNKRWGMSSGYTFRGCIVNPDIKEEKAIKFKIGDKVEPTKLVSYSGKKLSKYDKYYYITDLDGDRAVLSAKRNGRYYVWSAINTKNIKINNKATFTKEFNKYLKGV